MKAAQPGEPHAKLKAMVGTWTTASKMWMGPGEPKESKGVLKRKMIMDGRFLREKFDGDFFGRSSAQRWRQPTHGAGSRRERQR